MNSNKRYTTTLFTEDIKNAINCAKTIPLPVVANVFRLLPNQLNNVKRGRTTGTYSINCTSGIKSRGVKKAAPACMGNRSIEAAATLQYMGYTQKEIAEMFGVTHQTISRLLINYHGYKKNFTK